MHPETKKLTQKNMPILTLTENLKLHFNTMSERGGKILTRT